MLGRRTILEMLAMAVPTIRRAKALAVGMDTERGYSRPIPATLELLAEYQVPRWFREAKFGIWAHWGPQSAPEAGDWYARNMYIPGQWQYRHHLERYGHPSKFGFKDIIPTWKGDQFDPHYLVGLYKRAGAKYFVSMGVHHDNFDLWNSKQTRSAWARSGILSASSSRQPASTASILA